VTDKNLYLAPFSADHGLDLPIDTRGAAFREAAGYARDNALSHGVLARLGLRYKRTFADSLVSLRGSAPAEIAEAVATIARASGHTPRVVTRVVEEMKSNARANALGGFVLLTNKRPYLDHAVHPGDNRDVRVALPSGSMSVNYVLHSYADGEVARAYMDGLFEGLSD